VDHPEGEGDEHTPTGAPRARDRQRGAASQRLLLALSASAILTAVVTLPMAYRAHEGREQTETERATPAPRVLGTAVEREDPSVHGDLYWASPTEGTPTPLHDATVRGAPRLLATGDDVVRADFRLDDGPVHTDRAAPWELDDGTPVELGTPGAETSHSLTVVLTHPDGRSTLRQAFFTHDGT
jgi:hypothetical protein